MGVVQGEKRWVRQVLEFWFDELSPGDWFRANSAVDDVIASQFLELHDEIRGSRVETHSHSALEMLACVIVLDQFSRNLFRGSARAFASDPRGLAMAKVAIANGFDMDVSSDRRVFFYLPFEHSEDLAEQERCVALVGKLGNEVHTRYAKAHFDIIKTYGRFPHRNGVLGRVSTPAEQAYLAQPDSGF